MLDIKYIKESTEEVIRRLAKKGKDAREEIEEIVSLDKENVICETVKEAEDTLDTVIRLYESKNIRTKVRVSVNLDASKCYLCDLLENELEELDIVDGTVCVDVKGFEIVTLKFKK